MADDYVPLGSQPVRVLELNVLDWFETKYPEFLTELKGIVEGLGASRSIKYWCQEAPVLDNTAGDLTPYVHVEDGQIHVHETFLSYIWALSYSILVIFDESLHGPRTGQRPQHGMPLGHFTDTGYKVLSYGLSLRRTYARWPSHLPNPESGRDGSYFTTRANGIYCAAVDFILCHELAHIACGHVQRDRDTIARKEFIPSHEIKLSEAEADEWATERVLRGVREPGRPRTMVLFGAITGLASLLFLSPELSSATHPDTDARIRGVLDRAQVDCTDNLWGVVAAHYAAWAQSTGTDLRIFPAYDTYADLVAHMEGQMAPLKAKEGLGRLGID